MEKFASSSTTFNIRIILLAIFAILLGLGGVYAWLYGKNLNSNTPSTSISSFEECVRSGYPVMESFPRQCRTKDGRLFVEQLDKLPVPIQPAAESNLGGVCKNLCGDGVCQEMVCQAVGCPCAETVDTCPGDCSEDKPSASENQEWQTYRNKKYGYSLQYPKSWEIGDRLEFPEVENSNHFAVYGNSSGKYFALYVDVNDYPYNEYEVFTIQEYLNKYNQLRNSSQGWNIVSKSETILFGVSAIIQKIERPDHGWAHLQTFFFKNNNFYRIELTTDLKSFSEQKLMYDEIMKTFSV